MRSYKTIPRDQTVVEVFCVGEHKFTIARMKDGTYAMYCAAISGFEKIATGKDPVTLESKAIEYEGHSL